MKRQILLIFLPIWLIAVMACGGTMKGVDRYTGKRVYFEYEDAKFGSGEIKMTMPDGEHFVGEIVDEETVDSSKGYPNVYEFPGNTVAFLEGDKGGKQSIASKGRKVWLGATLKDVNGTAVFASVANDGPAEDAGIAPGDQAVALDGLRVTSANLEKRLRACHEGDELEFVVFRDDELVTTTIRIEAAPEDTCYLELDEDVELPVENLRIDWLHGSQAHGRKSRAAP